MNKKSSPVTIPQAMKIYLGTGMMKETLLLSLFPLILLLTMLVGVFIIGLLEFRGDFQATASKLTGSSVTSFIYGLILAPVLGIELLLTYDRELPGGKFFRTVRGGFSTFAKFRTGLTLSMIVQTTVYLAVVLLLQITKLMPLKWGVSCIIATFISALLAIGLCGFAVIIKDNAARSITVTLGTFAVIITGPLSLYITDGRLTLIHLAAAAAAALLIFLSNKFVLAYYKKYRWLESR
ncbi:MAG: hypothetical protein IJ071_04955 [Ruminococcus sp.]|nr:hypothetical protein [Ruminococcus sp.]